MFVFFFKQKTAYEMRISDWSSDVCSSDLEGDKPWVALEFVRHSHPPALQHRVSIPCAIVPLLFQRFISGEEIHARAVWFVAGTGLRGRRDRLRDLFGRLDQPAAGGQRTHAADRRRDPGRRRPAERRGGKEGGSTWISRW